MEKNVPHKCCCCQKEFEYDRDYDAYEQSLDGLLKFIDELIKEYNEAANWGKVPPREFWKYMHAKKEKFESDDISPEGPEISDVHFCHSCFFDWYIEEPYEFAFKLATILDYQEFPCESPGGIIQRWSSEACV